MRPAHLAPGSVHRNRDPNMRFISRGYFLLLPMLGAVLAISLSGPADAQRDGFRRGQSTRDVAGQFDYYTLVLSWSPTYCASEARPGDPQCSRTERPYAFVLHGLWPQYERGFPESCRTRERPFVPDRVISQMMDIMPSRSLVIHEYRKHGTCSGLNPEQYYALSRQLFEKIKIPQRFISPQTLASLSPGEVTGAFLTANPTLKPDMLAVSCRGSGNRLREVRVCFSREGVFRRCGSNELGRSFCSASKMYIPPVRGGNRAGPSRGRGSEIRL